MIRRAAVPLVAALALALAPAAAKERPRIEDLHAELTAESARVVFRLADGLSDEALERIDSGIPVTIRHRVELTARRTVPLLPARVLARARIDETAHYDSLTRRFTLTREVQRSGRGREDEPPAREERVVETREAMEAWFGRPVEVRLDLPERLPATGRLRAHVESFLDRRYVLWVFPDRVTASAETKLEP